MSRLKAFALLVGILHLSGCGKPVAPVAPLTAEELAVVGTYTLTTANGKAPPAVIGNFISSSAGAQVTVTSATLVLGPDSKKRSSARLNVTVEYLESDPIQGTVRRNDSRETVAIWSLSGSTLSFQEGNPTFVMTSGSVSGTNVTVNSSGAGLYGAVSPTVVLVLKKQ